MRPRGSGLHVDMHLRHAVRMAARQAFLQEAPQGAGHVCKLLKQQQPCTKAACATTTTHRGPRCRLSALCKRPLSARGRASHNIGAGGLSQYWRGAGLPQQGQRPTDTNGIICWLNSQVCSQVCLTDSVLRNIMQA